MIKIYSLKLTDRSKHFVK